MPVAKFGFEDDGRSQGIVEGDKLRVLEESPSHRSMRRVALGREDLVDPVPIHPALLGDVEPDQPAGDRWGVEHDPRCLDVDHDVPLGPASGPPSKHCDMTSELRKDLWLGGNKLGDVRQRSDREKHDLSLVREDRLAEELHRCPRRSIKPVRQLPNAPVLLALWLPLTHDRFRPAEMDGDIVPALCPESHLGNGGPFFGLAGHNGDAEQFAPGVPRQIGERKRIVEVRSGIGVDENFDPVYG